MAITAAEIGAGVGIIGDVMSSMGQSSTNAQAAAIAQANNQTQIMLAQNAMQYRVEDLKKAGLNPMLATTIGGMQAPIMQQPNLQNPGAAFAGAGQQVTNAMQLASLQSQIRKTNADAGYTESLTPRDDVLPVDADGHVTLDSIMRAPGGMLGKMSVAQAAANLDQVNATIDNLRSTTDVNRTVNQLRQVDVSVAQASAKAVIQKAVNDAGLSGQELSIEQARAKVLGGPMGPAIQAVESVLGGGFLGQVLGGALSRLGGSKTVETSHVGPGGVYRGGTITTTR